jgi:hypothetical protein
MGAEERHAIYRGLGERPSVDLPWVVCFQDRELSDGKAILTVSGEIDLATASEMVSQFQELADRDLTDVIVDAREVSSMDFNGLHGLLEGKRIFLAVTR